MGLRRAGSTSTLTAARSRRRNGGKLAAGCAPLTSSLPHVPPAGSGLESLVATSTTAFMLPRFFAQMTLFSVSLSSFSLSPI